MPMPMSKSNPKAKLPNPTQPSPAPAQASTANASHAQDEVPGPGPKRSTAPKMDMATLALIQADYVNGNCKSVYDLAHRYKINPTTLHARVNRENWEELRLEKMKELQSKVSEKAQSIGETYLKSTFARMKKYERMIDASQQHLGSKDADGNPLLDPDALNSYTLSEQRINAIAMSALRIPTIVSNDVTSKGQSIGESLVTAIERLRVDPKTIDISIEQADAISKLEVIDGDGK